MALYGLNDSNGFTGNQIKEVNGYRDQARGRLVQNSPPRGQNFVLNGTRGEVGVSLKKKNFFRETHFHSLTTQTQAVVTLSDNLLPLHYVSPSIKWQ